jgi:putative transposase
MLSPEKLTAWYYQLNLSLETRSVIDRVRSSQPARRVGGGRSNVSGRYPSRKMGMTIQFESHRVELAGIYEMEHDDSVEEFYDQPPTIKLDYLSAEGRHLGVMHTPDFFVIRQDTAGWEEWKTEEELVRLAQKSPHRYELENGNRWRCPPGEEYARPLGLYYRVRSSGEINWVFQRNIQFLEDYLRSDSVPISSLVRERLLAYVLAWPGASLRRLLEDCAGIAAPDDIYSSITTSELYVDLAAAALAEPWDVRVYSCRDAALACSAPREQPSQNSGDPALQSSCASMLLTPNPATSEVIKRLLEASEDDLRVANERSEIIRRHLNGDPPSAEPVPPRTLGRWLLEYRAAKRFWGTGYVGLLPRPRPGNCHPRLRRACEREGVPTPCYMTFCRAVRKRNGSDQTSKRKGHRAAYAQEPFYFELELKTPRHGDRPFEICHIDHTELDIELVCSHTGQNLGRPWYTILTDAFSRRLLAIFLTFDPPSYDGAA